MPIFRVSGGLGAGGDGAGVYSGWVTGSCRAECLLLLTPVHLAGDFWLGFGAGTRGAKNLVPIKPPSVRSYAWATARRPLPCLHLPVTRRNPAEPGGSREVFLCNPRHKITLSPAALHYPSSSAGGRLGGADESLPVTKNLPGGLWTQPLNALSPPDPTLQISFRPSCRDPALKKKR